MCSCWNWHWKQTTTRLSWRVFSILITLCKYVLCWISMNWPIDCGPYCLVGHQGRGGFPLQPEIQNSWAMCQQTVDLTRDCLTNKMNQNESEWRNQRFRFRTLWLPLQLSATEMFSIWTSKKTEKDPLSFRKTFYDMWNYVNSLI